MNRLALFLVFLPAGATGTLACNCPDPGSYVEIEPATLAKNPSVEFKGDVTWECEHRGAGDKCDGYWLTPHSTGTATVILHFPDGTSASDSVDYLYDGHYPCRGDLRPVTDHVSRL